MKCPIDQTELQMNERQGVEIDYCPKCRGVWLDRGELDKLVEHSDPRNGGTTSKKSGASRDNREDGPGEWLGNLFDF